MQREKYISIYKVWVLHILLQSPLLNRGGTIDYRSQQTHRIASLPDGKTAHRKPHPIHRLVGCAVGLVYLFFL